jgi:hypothetical protein
MVLPAAASTCHEHAAQRADPSRLPARAKRDAVHTTVSDRAAPCPLDRVSREVRAPRPNVLWVADLTCVATWAGFVYVALVIDTFARRIPRVRLCLPGPDVSWRGAGMGSGRIGDGPGHGARSRSPIACRSTSRTTRGCASAMKPSIGRSSFKAEGHCAAS